MQRLLASSTIHRAPCARSVVLWLLLALAAALASPLVHAPSVELLCTGTGSVKLRVGDNDDTAVNTSHSHDCMLCAQASAPPAQAPVVASSASVSTYAPRTQPFTRTAWPAAPPLPARGPPKTRLA